jgi:hypothetical protein
MARLPLISFADTLLTSHRMSFSLVISGSKLSRRSDFLTKFHTGDRVLDVETKWRHGEHGAQVSFYSG